MLSYVHRTIIVTIYLLLVAYNCVTCCEDQCYRPEGVETRTSSVQSEDELIINGICYSSCALNLQTYQIDNFNVVNTSALNCSQQRQLNGCITGCNATTKTSDSCQQLCSACQVSDTTECNSCSYSACMIGCNATIDTANTTGINLDTINVTLIPVPGQPYVYKASVESINTDSVSVSRATSDISSFIIRVSTRENNLTTYNLLHDPSTDYVDLLQYAHHCNLAEVSVAVIDSNGVSDYSPATEMCISAIYPKAATGFQACFGEKLMHNSSRHWIINLRWILPEDRTYLQGFELNVASTTASTRCQRTNFDSTLLEKDQTSYTLGLQEDIERRCDYQIILTSLPKNNDNNSIMTIQDEDVPDPICSERFPQYSFNLIRQYNDSIGKSHYSLDLTLQSDPAALQALTQIVVSVQSDDWYSTPANPFPQLLIPFPNATTTDNYGSACFSDQNRQYTCSENCNSLQYSGSQFDNCIEVCERARHYTIQLGTYLTNVTVVMGISFDYPREYNYRCPYNQKALRSFQGFCFTPTAPRNFNYTVEIQPGISNVLLVNFTWDIPETTHGEIYDYFVEYITNDTFSANTTTTSDTILETRVFREIFHTTLVRVRANNRCGYSNWSTPLLINLTEFFPTTSASSDDDPPLHRYYIATGVIVGCMVFAAVVLAIILICCCYVCRETEKDKVYIDESSIIGTHHRNANRASTLMNDEFTDLPIDLWEMSPDNIVMDETTFFGCGNFGEVYKGCLKIPAKSPTESYPAGKTVAVKLLQEGAGGELKHDFLQEINLMKKVAQGCNPFVVNMIGCCTIEEPLALIMEFVSGGNLLEFLKSHRRKRAQSLIPGNKAAPYLEPVNEYSHLKSKQQQEDENRKPLTIADQLTFAYQIACGMEYLSGKGIVHRDLACRNVLVGDQNTMKIADFGLSRHLYDDPVYVKNQDGKLPIRWMAIEAILERKYSVQSDVWSFGIVIWELVTFGSYPYPSLTNIEVVDALLKGFRMECPEDYVCPPELYTLAERCWDADPELRPSFNMMATEISKMIPDYDPNQYVEIARFPPYCEMHATDDLQEKDAEKKLDSAQNDS